MNLKLFLFLIPCFLLFACGPQINEQQQKQLTQLTKDVDSVHAVISAIDSAEALEMVKGYMERRNYLLQEMKDTLSPDIIFYLDTFLTMRKSMQFFESQYFPILEESRIVKTQLRDLNTDVSNRLVDENRFASYYQLEQDNFMKLLNVSSEISRKYKVISVRYEKMLPTVDSIINSAREKSNE